MTTMAPNIHHCKSRLAGRSKLVRKSVLVKGVAHADLVSDREVGHESDVVGA